MTAESESFDRTFSPSGSTGRELSADVAMNSSVPIAGGVQANDAKESADGAKSAADRAESAAKKNVDGLHSSGTDNVRDVFG